MPGTTPAGGLLKVVVSDGFRSAEDGSNATFTVAHKPPRAAFLDPRDNQLFLECERVQAQGMGLDVEGPPAARVWTVDGVCAAIGGSVQLGPQTPGPNCLV